MKIKETIQGKVAVLAPSGNLMGGSDTQNLHDHVKSLIGDGISNVVIDLSKVKWMNSSGLGALIAAMTSLKNANGNLKLSNVTDKVNSLLMITQMIRIFETYTTADRAVAAFQEAAKE
jgi:anti-sigma B factor antagonist